MKYIFMGKVIQKEYYVKYANYDTLDYCTVLNKEHIKCLALNQQGRSVIFKRYNEVIKEWKEIGSSELICEKLNLGNLVLINNEELEIEKIVQKENGDVICYLDKIINKLDDEESLELSNKLMDLYNIEALKFTKQKMYLNKKWYKFWK